MESTPPEDLDPGQQRDGDFSDMLSEMRILLPGAQTLSAFLILLPFNAGFAKIDATEKIVFLATFFRSRICRGLWPGGGRRHGAVAAAVLVVAAAPDEAARGHVN